jgi:hypothetical protein
MNRWLLGTFFLVAPLGCATGNGDIPDATSTIDVTLQDQAQPEGSPLESAPQDGPFPHDAGSENTFDVIAPMDVIAPTDVVPPKDGGKDVAADAPLNCLSAGTLCNYELDNCPAFWECELAIGDGGLEAASFDAGPDAPEVEGGLGGSNDGVCLYFVDVATAPACPCATGERCLTASQICLTAAEATCVCDNPKTAAACGPP